MLGRVLFDAPRVLGRFSDYAVTGTFQLVRVRETLVFLWWGGLCFVGSVL